MIKQKQCCIYTNHGMSFLFFIMKDFFELNSLPNDFIILFYDPGVEVFSKYGRTRTPLADANAQL